MRCLGCHYDLQNLSEHRCPECGREFDPNDPGTFQTPESRVQAINRFWLRMAVRAFIVASTSLLATFLVVYFLTLSDRKTIPAWAWRDEIYYNVLFNWPVSFIFVLVLYAGALLWLRTRRSKE